MATDADKIKVTILPTGTMHADLTWLLIDPQRMATRSNPARQKDWVPVPTHVVYIEHPDGKKLLWDAGVPRDWEQRWGPTGLDQFFPVDEVTDDMTARFEFEVDTTRANEAWEQEVAENLARKQAAAQTEGA